MKSKMLWLGCLYLLAVYMILPFAGYHAAAACLGIDPGEVFGSSVFGCLMVATSLRTVFDEAKQKLPIGYMIGAAVAWPLFGFAVRLGSGAETKEGGVLAVAQSGNLAARFP